MFNEGSQYLPPLLMKNLTSSILLSFLFLTSCEQKNSQTNITKIYAKQVILTDSSRLRLHLDSLPKIKFPYESSGNNAQSSIDLSEFKNKQLFNVPYKRMPRAVGGGFVDENENDTTFNLVDTNYKAQWNLVAKTPKFVVVKVCDNPSKMVTLTYNLKMIDAITFATSQGNNHWTAQRFSTINQDLNIVLYHQYRVQVDDKDNFHYQTEHEKWFIDKKGYFKKR